MGSVIASLTAAAPTKGTRTISREMIQTVTLDPNRSRSSLTAQQIGVVKAIFFSEEGFLRDSYRRAVPNRAAESAYWMERIRTNQQTPNAVFYFLRWLADDNWFGPTEELYLSSKHWQARLLCIGSASRWARDHDAAFQVVLKGLSDKSIEVAASAVRGCAYSLNSSALPHLIDLKERLAEMGSARCREAEILIENTFAAIKTQNHHRFCGTSPRVGLVMWPWDDDNISMAELDLNWRLRVLHRELGERFGALGCEPLPELRFINLSELQVGARVL